LGEAAEEASLAFSLSLFSAAAAAASLMIAAARSYSEATASRRFGFGAVAPEGFPSSGKRTKKVVPPTASLFTRELPP
jgi:hypothetical protein